MLDVLSGFVGELRAAGLPISLTETVDAAEAVRQVPIEDRRAFKAALGATLCKSVAHWRIFDTTFEVYFASRGDHWAIPPRDAQIDEEGRAGAGQGDAGVGQGAQGPAGGGGSLSGLTREELAELLFAALAGANLGALAAIARQAVLRFAGMEPGRPVGGTYYLYRTMRALDVDGLMERLMDHARDAAGPEGGLTALEERLARDEMETRIARLKDEVEAEIRRRLVADRGARALARSIQTPLPEEIDFMHASRDELMALRRAIHPLTRRLAARLARRRRHGHRGNLDFRDTIRHSLSYGGVPVDPRFKYPRPAKPEIFVIADISGSVAAFARFTLHLVYAISAQFSRVRSFVFVDGIDEVTEMFERADDIGEAIRRVNTEADVIWLDGHSDYGHAFEAFYERWGEEVTSRSSVLVLGDARNNYHASQAWVLKEVGQKARHLHWLNPEPRAYWGTGDSILGQYAPYCDGVHECRNLRQLERFVEELT